MTNSNVFIAMFMNLELDIETGKFHRSGDWIYPSELLYHTSWDWLMPVVEEMHTYGCEVVISSNGVTTIYAPSGEVLAEESSEEDDHMLDATYKAIVKVLKENLHKPCE